MRRAGGSPTIRVDGPTSSPAQMLERSTWLARRVYGTAAGPAGTPDERWLRDALAA